MKIVKIEDSKVSNRGVNIRNNEIVENMLLLKKGEVLEVELTEYTAIIGSSMPSVFLGRLRQFKIIGNGEFKSKKIRQTVCFIRIN